MFNARPEVLLHTSAALAMICMLGFAAAIASSSVSHAQAVMRERLDQSVELWVPVAPAVVNIGGVRHLVHELHVTNMRREAVTLGRVRVFTVDGAGPLATFEGAELAGRIGRPGLPPRSVNPEVVGPGLRAVVYFWTPLSPEAPGPESLSLHLDLSIPDGNGRRDVQVRSPATAVSNMTAIAIDPPLAGGPWVAIYSPLLVGGHRTALYTLDGRARIPGRFAIDWIRPPREGNGRVEGRAGVQAGDNGFGTDVLAVGDARVATAIDDMPDLPPDALSPLQPVPLERASGNYIALDLGGGRFAFYEHLRQGSVKVRTGDLVTRGQPIAQLGSSGSTSIGPHLHFHVTDANSTLAAEGMPFVFRQLEHLGAYESLDALLAGGPWTPPTVGGAGVRRLEHPESVAVVRF